MDSSKRLSDPSKLRDLLNQTPEIGSQESNGTTSEQFVRLSGQDPQSNPPSTTVSERKVEESPELYCNDTDKGHSLSHPMLRQAQDEKDYKNKDHELWQLAYDIKGKLIQAKTEEAQELFDEAIKKNSSPQYRAWLLSKFIEVSVIERVYINCNKNQKCLNVMEKMLMVLITKENLAFEEKYSMNLSKFITEIIEENVFNLAKKMVVEDLPIANNLPIFDIFKEGNFWPEFYENNQALPYLIDIKKEFSLEELHFVITHKLATLKKVEEILNTFKDRKIDINQPLSDGHTLLTSACNQGDIDTAKSLLKAGAEIEASNSEENTPLAYACKKGHLDLVKILLNGNANPNTPNGKNPPTLFQAIGLQVSSEVKDEWLHNKLVEKAESEAGIMQQFSNNYANVLAGIMQQLSNNYANVLATLSNLPGTEKKNVLEIKITLTPEEKIKHTHEITEIQALKVVSLLVNNKADLKQVNNEQQTAQELARSLDYEKLVQYLNQHA